MRKFFADALFVQILNLLVKPVWILVIDRAVQNYLPAEAYGGYFSLLSFSFLFIIILDLGINTYNNRSVAVNDQFFAEHFRELIKVKTFLSLIYAAVVLVIGWVVGISAEELPLLILLIVMQILTSFSQFIRSNITAWHWFKKEGILSVTDRFVAIIGIAAFLWIPDWKDWLNAEIFVAIQLCGVAIALILGLGYSWSQIKHISKKTDSGLWRKILKESWPFALLAALMGLYTRIDAVMLKFLHTDGALETDVYAMGYRLLDAGNMFAAILSGMLLPYFSRLLSQKNDTKRQSHVAYGWMFLGAAPIVFLGHRYGFQITSFLYPDKADAYSANIFSLLMTVFPAAALVFVFGALLTAAGSIRWLNRMAIASFILNFSANLILIPEFGAEGAAFATLSTQWFFGLACVIRCYSKFKWRFDLRGMTYWVLWLGILFVSIFYIPQIFPPWLIQCVAVCVLAVVLAVIFNLAEIRKGFRNIFGQ
jgi:O-antigen/teichoic acid export membrane protein